MLDKILPIIIVFSVDICQQFMRYKLTKTMNSTQFMILNTFIISIIVLLYYIIKSLLLQTHDIKQSFVKWREIDLTSKIIMISIALFTVIYTTLSFTLDKDNGNYPTFLVLSVKSVLLISIILFNCALLKTKLTNKQLLAIFVLIFGLYLMHHEHNY